MAELSIIEMEAKIAERPDLLQRLKDGDASAFVAIMNHVLGTSGVATSIRRIVR